MSPGGLRLAVRLWLVVGGAASQRSQAGDGSSSRDVLKVSEQFPHPPGFPDFGWGDALGIGQRGQGGGNRPALGMRPGHVHEEPGLPFRRERRGIDSLRQIERFGRVPELDGYRDLMELDIGGVELGAVVVGRRRAASPGWRPP